MTLYDGTAHLRRRTALLVHKFRPPTRLEVSLYRHFVVTFVLVLMLIAYMRLM